MLLYINLYTFLIGLSKAAYIALFNLYLRSLSYGNQVVGNATFYYSWGVAIGGLIFSGLSDKIGRKNTLLLTMPIFSLFGLLRLNPMPAFWLYFVSFIFGFFDTSIILPTISVIESSDEKKRLRNSNVNFAIVMLTGVLGYFGAGVLSEKIGLLNSLRLAMTLSLISVLPIFKLPKVKSSLKKTIPTLNIVQFTILVYYLISGALVSAAAGVFINFGNVIFLDLFTFSTSMITLILTISQLSTAVTSLFSDKLIKKVGYKFSLFFFYTSVTILIFAMPAIISQPISFTLAYILRYIFLNITTPMFTVFCLSYLPNSYLATFSGISYFINNTMRAISAQIFSHLSKNGATDYFKLFFTTGMFYLFNTLLTLITFFAIAILTEKKVDIEISLFSPKKKAKRKRRIIISKRTNPSSKPSVHLHGQITNQNRNRKK